MQARIDLVIRHLRRLPLQWRTPAKKVSFSVFGENQSVREVVAAIVKSAPANTVAAAVLQKREPLPAKLEKKKRKTRSHR
jgi:hypothetical protein